MHQYVSGLCTKAALLVVIPLGLVSNSSAVFAQTSIPNPTATPSMGEGQRPPRPPRQRPNNPPTTDGQAPTNSSPNNQNRPPRPPRMDDGTGNGQRPPRPPRQRPGNEQNPPNNRSGTQNNQTPLTPPTNTDPS